MNGVILSETKNLGIDIQMFRLSPQHDKLSYQVLQNTSITKYFPNTRVKIIKQNLHHKEASSAIIYIEPDKRCKPLCHKCGSEAAAIHSKNHILLKEICSGLTLNSHVMTSAAGLFPVPHPILRAARCIIRPYEQTKLKDLQEISDKYRDAFEKSEYQFQNLQDIPGVKSPQMSPEHVLRGYE